MLRLVVSMMVLFLPVSTACAAVERPAILVFGDSLSAGYGISVSASWPHLLQQRLHDEGYRHSVINASISGETTAGGARRLPALMDTHKPEVVVVALGSNDGLRGISPAETRKNLLHMLASATRYDARVVLLKVRIPPNYGPRYSTAFEAVFDELGADTNVIYAPFMLRDFAADASAFQPDGLHPTAAAQARILDTLWPSLATAVGADTRVAAP